MATVTGGDKFKAALAEIAAKLTNASTVQVGFPADATYPDGVSVPLVAAIQTFGAPSIGIPPRPFMQNTVAKNSGEWPAALDALLQNNGYDAANALAALGHVIEGQLRDAIIELDAPALSDVTIMLRGMKRNNPDLVITGATVGEAAARIAAGKTNYAASTKPLVASGHMLDSITSQVD